MSENDTPAREPFAPRVPISWNRLTGNSLKVAVAISSFASVKTDSRGKCHVRREKIAERAFPGAKESYALKAVTAALKELQSAGVINVRRTGKASWFTVRGMLDSADPYPEIPQKPSDQKTPKVSLLISQKLSHQKTQKMGGGSERYVSNGNSLTVIRNGTRNDEGAVREEPSDPLIEALRPFKSESYTEARDEGRQLLKTLGREYERLLIDVLSDERTALAQNPIGFALSIARRGGFEPVKVVA